jgi:hypothetical protein
MPLAIILLPVLASTGAMAHGGTDQEEKACAPDVQRFCRSGRSYDFGLPQGKSSKAFFPDAATCWSTTGNGRVGAVE